MNWLAHVFLSKPHVECRLGNLLADLVKGANRAGMSDRFLDGVRQHEAVDAFTDTHAVVRRSRSRIATQHRHTSGILIDVFYDHFLALDWDRYSQEPLEQFTSSFYGDIREHPIDLPQDARHAVEHMISEDRLMSYRRLDGIETALRKVSIRLDERLGRDLHLERGVSELVANFEQLRADFTEFFPQLQAQCGI